MNEASEFTPDERFLVEHYRHPDSSSGRRNLLSLAAIIPASLLCMALSFTGHDPALGVAAYVIVLYQLVLDSWRARRWAPVLGSVFRRYEARIATLEDQLANRTAPK